MALTINEEWIRERVGLKHNNLEDVRSLSLPGTYHEKIGNFGESFRKFTRLKSLDLSRNSVESLAGLENLKLLEKLNVYYNTISTLQELHRLRYNQNLQDLDLRLNPVARNEPDYRLFLIHMLPNLKRLDDRAVRDSERKAALMHFTTDQANDLTEHPKVQEPATQEPNPRIEHVKSLSKPPHLLDEDDVQVLEFMNPNRGELTGSANKEAAMEEYPPQTLRDINRAGIGMEFAEKQTGSLQQPKGTGSHPPQLQDPALREFQAKYPNLPLITTTGPPAEPTYGHDLHVQTSQNKDNPNLKFQDEMEAYTSYKSQGHFTPKPMEESSPQRNPVELPNTVCSVELYTADDLEKDLQTLTQKIQQPGNEVALPMTYPSKEHIDQQPDAEEHTNMEMTGDTGEFIKKVSTIVDKYWNGSKSLLKNIRFKSQMAQMLKEYRQANNDTQSVSSMASTNASLEFEMSRLKHSLEKVKKENEDLKEKLFQAPNFESLGDVDESKLKQSFVRAQRDVKILRDRLQRSIEENKTLQDQLAGQGNTPVASTKDVSSSEITTIRKENNQLQRQIENLNIKLKQFNQMQELASMLQESHKSLVQTNDHLLKEMEETRQRHKIELQQLTWNYNQLKRSVGQANIPNYNG